MGPSKRMATGGVPRQEMLVECVPNISEGRRPQTIATIADAITATPGVRLLDVSADASHNRSVFTFVGPPEPVVDAALAAADVAVRAVDMRTHRGRHPRIGAVDVVPFVPLRGVDMETCVALSRCFARALWARHRIPVYFYGYSALRPKRRWLPNIRRGQYEALRTEIVRPERHPDVGKPELHPTAGATATGARGLLVAWNVNIVPARTDVAREIARRIRQSSGGFEGLQAMGVDLAERGVAQISMNVLDYRRAPLHRVFEAIRTEAAARGVEVAGSEFIGLVPMEALLGAAHRHLATQGLPEPSLADVGALVEAAAKFLRATNLDRLRVLEVRLEEAAGASRE
ncbi:MAG: glutamate formimidoyltransferase [Armatimonadota bacterium]|nr:glutamate formimidoyltransferase [Armatimonadota bacterium]MDR5697337.1 glutamate formimidoyltransferase [Armatimonadota bacterium]